jgi:hypothetical protein
MENYICKDQDGNLLLSVEKMSEAELSHPGRPRQRPEDYPGQQPDRKDLLQRTKIP